MRSFVIAFAFVVLAFPQAHEAHAEDVFPAVKDPVVRKECSECHMLYQPEMLTQGAWRIMLGELFDHFGEDASLSPETTKLVLDYHLANAADVTSFKDAKRFLRRIDPNNPPLAISRTPRFLHKHERISPEVWKRKNVKSKSNCVGCHLDAGKGDYERLADALMYQWVEK